MDLAINPPTPITIATDPVYNTYTLTCSASLPVEFQSLDLTISWLDFTAEMELTPNASISIRNYTNSMVVGEDRVTVFGSELTVVHNFMNRSQISVQGCSTNVVYYQQMDDEPPIVFTGVVNATKTVTVNGKIHA